MTSCLISVLMSLFGAPVDDLKTIKSLPVPTYSWPVPSEILSTSNAELAELTRITGSIGIYVEGTKAQTSTALQIAKPHAAKLAVLFRPWLTATDPMTDAVFAEFGKSYSYWKANVASAINESTYKPPIICLVDTETFDTRTEPARSRIADLYGTYQAFLITIAKCERVEWYGFGQIPAATLPDGWSYQNWAVPFGGQQSVGYEVYLSGEIHQKREASWRARSTADIYGIPSITAWVAAPGYGRVYDWNPFTVPSFDVQHSLNYDAELGRELFVGWYRNPARDHRYMSPVGAVISYPHWLDPRIIDMERKHLIAFLRGATE